MTIGQALALMRSAEQFKDYQNRLNAQPTIDWRDVTQQQVGPEAPPVGYASMPMGQAVFAAPPPVPAEEYTQYEAPVGPPDQYAVESPVAGEPYVPMEQAPEPLGPAPFDYSAVVSNAQPEPVSPASQFAAYQQRVGAVGPDMFSRDFYEPQTDYSTRPPQQQAAFAALPFTSEVETQGAPKLPPPPIPGARRPESSAMFGLRPEPVSTDVPTEEPVAAGQELAMLVEPGQVKEEQKPTWSPGDQFNVKLNLGGKQYDAVVPKYTPVPEGRKPKPINVLVTTPDGKQRPVTIDPNVPEQQESYQAIVGKYNEMLPKVDTEFTSKVKVNDQWYDAKIDEATNQIMYKDPDFGVVSVPQQAVTRLTEEEFQGPVDERGRRDKSALRRIQEARRNWLVPQINQLTTSLDELRGGDTSIEMRSRLIGRITPSEGGEGGPVGGVEWWYRTDDMGVIPVKEAAEKGIVTGDLLNRLQEESSNVVQSMNSLAKGAEAVQSAEPEDLDARDLKKAEAAKRYWQGEAATRTGREQTKALEKVQEMQDRIDEINSRTGGAINVGGGINVLRGPGATTTSALDPTTLEGALALYSAAPSYVNPQVAPEKIKVLTQDDVAGVIADSAIKKTQKPVDVTYSSNLNNAIQTGLNPLLRRTQDTINKAVEEDPERNIEDFMLEESEFYPSDTFGRLQREPVRMSLQEALDNYNNAMNILKEVAAKNDIGNLGKAIDMVNKAGSMFTTAIVLPNGEVIRPEKGEMAIKTLNNVGPEITPAKAMELPVVAEPSATFPTRVVAPEEQQAMQQPRASGTRTPTPTYYPAFPVYYTPEDKYVKADTSTNFFEMINKNDPAYDKASANYTADAADRMTAAGIARALMRDGGGALQPDEIKAVTSTIDNLNKEIIKSPQMREAIVETIVETIEAAGIPISQDYSGLAGALEKVFNTASRPGVTDSEIQGMINRIIYGDRTASPQPWPGAFEFGNMSAVNSLVARDSSGGLQAQNLASNDPGKYGGRIAWGSTRSSSRLLDNAIQMIYDLALLYAAAGKGKTEYNVGPYTVTWFYNPLDPNQPRHQSVMTMPASIDQSSTGGTTAPPTTRGQAQNPASAPSPRTGVEPAMGGVMVKLQKIFGPRQYGVLSNAIGGVSAPIVREAKKNYDSLPADSNGLRNLHGVTSARPKDDEATKWTQQSGEMVSKVFGDQLLLGMIFGKRRDRQSFRSGGLQPFVSPNP